MRTHSDKSLLSLSQRKVVSDLLSNINEEANEESRLEEIENMYASMQSAARSMDIEVHQDVNKNNDTEVYNVYQKNSHDHTYDLIQSFGSIYSAYQYVMDRYLKYNEKLETDAERAESQSVREQQ